ncbi:MAG: LCP family protein [Chloroflexota bacterium]|nr:LCP family protein [Chloroflexota bacterium]
MNTSDLAPQGREPNSPRHVRSVVWRAAALAFAGILLGSAITVAPGLERQPAAAPDAGASSGATASLPFAGLMDLASILLVDPSTYTPADSLRFLGHDGRFTTLLLGSDARFGGLAGRTDAIIVASVDPATGKAAAFSIPRDMVNFPLPGGRRYTGKINALYLTLARSPTRSIRLNPGLALRKIIGAALGIEIDAYALLGFTGFRRLVNAVGGLDVYVARTFRDPTYSIRSGQHGITFTRGWHHLRDLVALAFARTRHGDNDYARARRQQQLVAAAVGKVETRGLGPLATLIAASAGVVKTDLQLNYAPLAFAMVGTANLTYAPRTVFGPRTFAISVGGTSNMLKMAACRLWIRQHFPPVHYNGTWLPPTPPAP